MSFDPPDRFNIADYFLTDRLAEGHGDRVALRLAGGTRTYADVERRAARFAAALHGLDVRPEERVILAMPDGEDYVGALFGILKIGAVVVMVNPAMGRENLAAILGYARARAAVVHAERADHVAGAAADAGATLDLVTVGGAVPGHHHLDDLDDAVEFPAVATHPDDPAIWLFSGGTTGAPKAVVQTHRSYANTTECYGKAAIGYRESDITIAVPKLYFGYATGSNLFFPFSVGGSSILFADHPTPAILFDQIARHHPTIMINVPSMIGAMLDHPGASDRDLSSLRLVTSAGEALPPALHDRWQDTYGVPLLDGLGTAEMWHVFLTNLPGDVRPGTLGRAVPGFRVEVRDDDGTRLPDGEVGQLWVAGDSRAIGYWRNMAKTKEVFRGEWVVTGDLVRMDADGYVTYVGRGDDAIKVKGKWLMPAEVESCLLEHEQVVDAVVIGAPDADGLLKPVAFVTVKEPTDRIADELKQFALDRLDAYKHPRVIHVVEDFPRTHLGKVNRRALRARAEVGLAGAGRGEDPKEDT